MNNYTITNQPDILSLIMDVYGTLEECVKFISDNDTIIPNLNNDISMLAGQTVYYDDTLVVTFMPPKPVLANPVLPNTEYLWLGKQGQNMFDVCIQTYGVLDFQIKLLTDNNVDFSTTIYNQPFSYDSTLIDNSTAWSRTTGMGIVFSSSN